MAFPISANIFVAFHRCKYKAHLLLAGHSGQKTDFELMQEKSDKLPYRPLAEADFLSKCPTGSVAASPPSTPEAIAHGHEVITHAHLAGQNATARVDALLRVPQRVSAGLPQYLPVLYVPHERLSENDKLLLAFHASVLAELQGEPPGVGLIIHGAGHVRARIRLPVLMTAVSKARAQLVCFAAGSTPPTPRPNSHCAICEFNERCRPEAERNGDLRLLRGLGQKEEAKLNKKGIFTITQLSYTFRPRRRSKAKLSRPKKHSHALQALAIRTGTIYVAGTPTLPTAPIRIFLDIESVPDRDFTYLIGVLVCAGNAQRYHPFWANGPADEADIWRSFLRLLESLPSFVLYHYGSFDARVIRRLRMRHGGDVKQLDAIEAASFNVVSAEYAHIFFPTYSNGLKDISAYLGFKWSEPNASGVQSLVWRDSWDETHDDDHKQKLVSYNHDDCRALRAVTDVLGSIITNGPTATATPTLPIVGTDDLPHERPMRFGRNEFVFPELDKVNRCAYFDYQRERVFVRTSPAVRKSLRRQRLRDRTRHAVNAEVILPRPTSCPACNVAELVRHQGLSKVVYDLKLLNGGIKRRVVRYLSCRYRCKGCDKIFTPKEYRPITGAKHGPTLVAWCVYQNIELLQSHNAIAQQLGELFGYWFRNGVASRFKAQAAERLQTAYDEIKAAVRGGPLVHADETKVTVRSGSGYVWVFTNLEEVLYVYSDTREGDTPKTILDGFKGVLVSDFYTAYDSFDCPQQKCLIHFIRDLNNDLLANPFDDELKALARGFTQVVAPAVETIDRYGLKAYHLSKHKPKVRQLLDRVDGSSYTSESAKDYQRRLRKYGGRMFTFLDYDGVPWNNNNAENAVKRFAFLRNVVGGTSTPDGIRQYLVLLSICETLKRKGVSFLDFLVSGEAKLAGFVDRK